MTNRLFVISTLVALGTTAPVFAQETTTDSPTEAAPTEDTGSSTNIGGALDLGEDATQAAPAAPAGQPETYIKETFTDWALQCLRVEDGNEVCQMYQLLKEDGGASVAEVSLFKLENGGQAVAGGTFVVPLETLLTAKLTVQVDNGPARRYDYSFCSPVGCYARLGFTQEDINRFRAGASAKVTLVPALAPDQTVSVTMSLSGFTAAYDAVSSLRQ